jgi:dihydroorotate dehydrogenase
MLPNGSALGQKAVAMTPPLAASVFPLLHRLDPERAHAWGLRALRLGLGGGAAAEAAPSLRTEALGLSFPNPIGLAAGFDKDAVAVPGLARLGFGFVETGTVTPRPQAGNTRPRLFRLTEDRAVINRMGFNNGGIDAYVPRLAAAHARRTVPLGANIGINREGADPERDYPALVAAVAPHADYVVLNVSSPNTPGLRDLQGEARLGSILAAIAASVPRHPPLLVKIAPDLADAGMRAVVETAVAAGVDGLIVSNTTLARPAGLRSPARAEGGGLSGAPLFRTSTAMLARAALAAGGRLTLIGCGGVSTGREAMLKIKAGASLVQIYTALVFAGPALVPRLLHELAAALREEGFASVRDALGVEAERLSGGAPCSS